MQLRARCAHHGDGPIAGIAHAFRPQHQAACGLPAGQTGGPLRGFCQFVASCYLKTAPSSPGLGTGEPGEPVSCRGWLWGRDGMVGASRAIALHVYSSTCCLRNEWGSVRASELNQQQSLESILTTVSTISRDCSSVNSRFCTSQRWNLPEEWAIWFIANSQVRSPAITSLVLADFLSVSPNVSRSEFEKNTESFVFIYFCIYVAVTAPGAGDRPDMKGLTQPQVNLSFKPFIAEWCITQGVSFTVSLGTAALSHHLQYPVITAVLRGTIREVTYLLYQLCFAHSLY